MLSGIDTDDIAGCEKLSVIVESGPFIHRKGPGASASDTWSIMPEALVLRGNRMGNAAGLAFHQRDLIGNEDLVFINGVYGIVCRSRNADYDTVLHQFLKDNLADALEGGWLDQNLVATGLDPLSVFLFRYSIEAVVFLRRLTRLVEKSGRISGNLSWHPTDMIVCQQPGLPIIFQKICINRIIKSPVLRHDYQISGHHLPEAPIGCVRQPTELIRHSLMNDARHIINGI